MVRRDKAKQAHDNAQARQAPDARQQPLLFSSSSSSSRRKGNISNADPSLDGQYRNNNSTENGGGEEDINASSPLLRNTCRSASSHNSRAHTHSHSPSVSSQRVSSPWFFASTAWHFITAPIKYTQTSSGSGAAGGNTEEGAASRPSHVEFQLRALPTTLKTMVELEGRALFATATSLTCLGFLLIGYDNGLMGGLVGQTAFNDTFNYPSPTIVGLIVAIYEVGCFFGSIFTSIFGEQMGRKRSIGLGVIIMVIGALLQATAYTRAHIVVARIVSGVGMGMINSTVPVFQSEYSPKSTRGLYVCMQLSTLNFGIFLAYWVDFGFSYHTGSYAWRIPCILQCIFLIPMLGILFIVPETPRWLASHDHADESLRVLRRIKKGKLSDEAVERLHADILGVVAVEKAVGAGRWRDLFRNDDLQSQRRFLTACFIQAAQQLGGINAIIYYAGTIFEKSVGFSPHMSSLMSGFLQTWFFVASFIPWALIDRVGRRPLLLSMITVMALVMAVQSALIYQVQYKTSVAHASGIAAAVMLFIFQGAFTIGFQATVWVYPTEILPLRLRQRGSSVSTACNWIFNYTIVQITPPAIANIGYRTYIIFAVLNAAWLPVIYLFFPETKGLELEDVDRLFAKQGTDTARMIDADAVRQASVAAARDVGRIVDEEKARVTTHESD